MKISPKLEWMRPYAELGMTFVSPDAVLERIGAWTLGKSRGRDVAASIHQRKNGEPYRIWMHTHYYFGDEVRPWSKIDLLVTLAHEIAHIEDWKHTPKHKKLEAKILSAFMNMLKKEGYVSEEAELKESSG